MPSRHAETKQWVEQGKLVLLGVTQEQHADRCRLFAQWHEFDWPILHDPINVLGLTGVPKMVAIDEHGIVRSTRPDMETLEAEFLDKRFSAGSGDAPPDPGKAARPDLDAMRRDAEASGSAGAWRELGDALVLWGGIGRINEAIAAYTRAVRLAPDDGDAQFRLGVSYRMRYESPQRMPADFQTAVDHWAKARTIRPNQYIWRRRVEQYGPRLIKPYPFYDWVETAASQIEARGEKPVELAVLPSGAEIAQPAKSFTTGPGDVQSPDPQGKIFRDLRGLIETDIAVVPPSVKPGESVRVHVTMRPNALLKAHWNNEAEPLRLWIDTPPGWKVEHRLLSAPQGEEPETFEPRSLELEVQAPADARGAVELAAYALYYVCEDIGGICTFLRQDIPIVVTVNP